MNRNDFRAALLNRVYTFGVICGGAFLLFAALFRPPAGPVTVESVVMYESTRPDSPVDPVALQEQFVEQIGAPGFLTAALDSTADIVVKREARRRDRMEFVDELAERIETEVSPQLNSPQAARVSLRVKGNEEFTFAFADQLSRQFRTDHHRPIDHRQRRREANERRSEVAMALARLDAAQAKVDAYLERSMRMARSEFDSKLRRHLESKVAAVREQASMAQQRNTVPVATPTPTPKLPRLAVVETVNPEWRLLNETLQQLKDTVGSNPNMSQAAEIGQLQAMLDSTPRIVEINSKQVDNPFVTGGSKPAAEPEPEFVAQLDVPETQPVSLTDLDELQASLPVFDEVAVRQEIEGTARFRELKSQLMNVEDEHTRRLADLAAITGPNANATTHAKLIQAAKVIDQEPPVLTRSFVLRLFTPALALGLLCSLIRVPADPPDVFTSTEDVASWLQLPIATCLATPDGPAVPEVEMEKTPAPIRVLTRAGEIMIGMALVLMMVGVVTMPEVAKNILSDPLSSYTHVIGKFFN